MKNDFLEFSKTLMCKVEDILANFGGVAWLDAYVVDYYCGTSYYITLAKSLGWSDTSPIYPPLVVDTCRGTCGTRFYCNYSVLPMGKDHCCIGVPVLKAL